MAEEAKGEGERMMAMGRKDVARATAERAKTRAEAREAVRAEEQRGQERAETARVEGMEGLINSLEAMKAEVAAEFRNGGNLQPVPGIPPHWQVSRGEAFVESERRQLRRVWSALRRASVRAQVLRVEVVEELREEAEEEVRVEVERLRMEAVEEVRVEVERLRVEAVEEVREVVARAEVAEAASVEASARARVAETARAEADVRAEDRWRRRRGCRSHQY
jgi:hypothetical protein